jgi:AcrR family transcriptional regulator
MRTQVRFVSVGSPAAAATMSVSSGVSKSSLYRTFESKDALIAAFAEEWNRRYWHW